MPGVYHFNDRNFKSFIDELSSTGQYELFANKSIQALLEFNFPLVREYIVKKLFVPFSVFLIFYEVYLNVIFGEIASDDTLAFLLDRIFLTVLVFYATYFLMNEFY